MSPLETKTMNQFSKNKWWLGKLFQTIQLYNCTRYYPPSKCQCADMNMQQNRLMTLSSWECKTYSILMVPHSDHLKARDWNLGSQHYRLSAQSTQSPCPIEGAFTRGITASKGWCINPARNFYLPPFLLGASYTRGVSRQFPAGVWDRSSSAPAAADVGSVTPYAGSASPSHSAHNPWPNSHSLFPAAAKQQPSVPPNVQFISMHRI